MLRLLIFMLALLAPAAAHAQGFISPLVGFDFGGDSGCPEITGCEEKNLNIGVSLGTLGRVIGAEVEIAYAKDFFGEIPDASSSVLTAMGNLMVAPRIGPVQPYALIGAGLIKSHVDFTTSGLLESTNNSLGWDVGGGLIIHLGDHFGLRGDVRYFHAFQDVEFAGFSVSETKLDFGRAAAGVVLKF